MTSLLQATLLPPFAKEHVPKILKQIEHLLKQSKNPKGYFVYEYVRHLCPCICC